MLLWAAVLAPRIRCRGLIVKTLLEALLVEVAQIIGDTLFGEVTASYVCR